MTARICVVGSGPAGCFAADALIRKLPDARIDVLDRLPSPFGLVRGGVAPDHQGTKAITRQFERLFQRPEVRFLGNIAVERDVSLDELRALYDTVVLAIGAPRDRRLGIPGDALPGVYGSGAFVGWYNGHPDHADLAPLLDRPGVAVIGNGNVALDVARVLAKTPAEMAASDLPAYAARALEAAPIRDIWILGRRGAADASFAPAELAELGRLEGAAPVVRAEDVAVGDGKVMDILRSYVASPEKPVRIHFLFHAPPLAVTGDSRVEALRLPDREIAVGTVITAIGYETPTFAGLPAAGPAIANDDGRVAPGLYVTGWCRRGPKGTIPTNRADAIAIAERVAAEVPVGNKQGGEALDTLLAQRGVRPVSFADWQRIAAAETERAAAGRPREKFISAAEMLAILGR